MKNKEQQVFAYFSSQSSLAMRFAEEQIVKVLRAVLKNFPKHENPPCVIKC